MNALPIEPTLLYAAAMSIERQSIIKTVRAGGGRFGKREIARELGLSGDERRELRQMLSVLIEDGTLIKTDRKTYRCADALAGVMVLRITGTNEHGDIIAAPEKWDGNGEPPLLRIMDKKPAHKRPGKRSKDIGARLAQGMRVLCRISQPNEKSKNPDTAPTASVIKILADAPQAALGVVIKNARGFRIRPVQKGSRYDYLAEKGADIKLDDLVMFELTKARHKGDRIARVTEVIGSANHPRSASMISLYEHNIPVGFGPAEIEEAKTGALPRVDQYREDIRDLPLITIDPVDAKDFDDAIFAEPDMSDKNKGGWIVWVAIADVAAYVRPGSALDKGAFKRGNSVYLPDRVVPMLPEELSADLCSLRPDEDRACLAVKMTFGADGEKRKHKFIRGLMRSHGRLTYAQAQSAFDGKPAPEAKPVADILSDVFLAYKRVREARDRRAPLDIDVPERKVKLDKAGNVTEIKAYERFDAHKLVEEFMIQANVAAAQQLEAKNADLIFRVHEPPDLEKVQGLADFLPALDLKWAMGERISTRRFNRLLGQAREKDLAETVGMSVLRTQSKAYYSPKNGGHFGLNLTHYAHFTSPIRRYADLVVHRALIRTLGFGDDGSSPAEISRLKEISEHISETERAAMSAERSANDRYIAAFLQDRIGAEFEGRIAGVTRAGLFIQLDETGADGFSPISKLGMEHYVFDEKAKAVIGAQTGGTYKFGMRVTVKLREAMPVTGGLIFQMLSDPQKGKPPKRAPHQNSYHGRRKSKRRS